MLQPRFVMVVNYIMTYGVNPMVANDMGLATIMVANMVNHGSGD